MRGRVIGVLSVMLCCACGEPPDPPRDDLEPVRCTLEGHVAVYVRVTGASVSSVTVTHRYQSDCDLLNARGDDTDAGSEPFYVCIEQGVGTYIVRVTSDGREWSKSVEIKGDECHVSESKNVTFNLDSEPSDR